MCTRGGTREHLINESCTCVMECGDNMVCVCVCVCKCAVIKEGLLIGGVMMIDEEEGME